MLKALLSFAIFSVSLYAQISVTIRAVPKTCPTGQAFVSMNALGVMQCGLVSGGGGVSFSSFIPRSPNGSIIIGNTGTATPTLSINTAALTGVLAALSGNMFGVNNRFAPSAQFGSLVLLPYPRPTNPVPGTLNLSERGVLEFWTGVVWKTVRTD